MVRKPPLTDPDAPVPTEAELREMRPTRDVLTPEAFAAVSSIRSSSGDPTQPPHPGATAKRASKEGSRKHCAPWRAPSRPPLRSGTSG